MTNFICFGKRTLCPGEKWGQFFQDLEHDYEKGVQVL
jgi:hypothetical protein